MKEERKQAKKELKLEKKREKALKKEEQRLRNKNKSTADMPNNVISVNTKAATETPTVQKKRSLTSRREEEEKEKKRNEKRVQARKADVYQRKNNTTQSILNYERMLEDGICVVKEDLLYSKCLEFTDINYRLVSQDEQDEIFNNYSKLLNSFDSNVSYQITLKNELIDYDDFKKEVIIESKNDDIEEYRQEYNQMILDKAKEGVNTVRRKKYITYSVRANNLVEARKLLNQAEESLISSLLEIYPTLIESSDYLKVLDGKERVRILQTFLDPQQHWKKDFNFTRYHKQELSSKDFLAADSADFTDKNIYEWGDYYGQVHFFKDLPSELTDHFLAELSQEPINMSVSIYAQSVPQDEALKLVKNKITWMNSQKWGETIKISQKVTGDPDKFVSQNLTTNIEEAEYIKECLTEESQRMFLTTFVVETMAETVDELLDNTYKIESVCRKYGIVLGTLSYEQKGAFNTALPIGYNLLDVSRTLTTSPLAIFMPFSAQELYEPSGFYYGVNAISKNLIMLDRTKRKNPSGMIMATPGSGKSFKAKEEIVSVLLSTDDEIIIVDPENEYTDLCRNFGGEVISIGPNTKNYINPLDLNTDFGVDEEDEDYNPISLKSEFLTSFFSMISQVGEGHSTLSPTEKTIIDRVTRRVYDKYLEDPLNNKMPNLRDYYEALRKEGDFNSANLATTLELYVTGTHNIFSHDSNIEISNRLVVFDILNLGDNLKGLGLLVLLDHLWKRVVHNKKRGKRTWIYMDEFYLMLNNSYSAQFLYILFKRSRKYNGVITGITQNISDMFKTQESRTVFSNSTGYICLLNQSEDDLATVTAMYGLSEEQQKYIYQSSRGQGIIISENAIVPFQDQFPKNTKLYRMMTSTLDELVQYQKQDEQKIAACKGLIEEYKKDFDSNLLPSIQKYIREIHDPASKKVLKDTLDSIQKEEIKLN